MFHLVLAEIIQAEREREIAELARQRQLLRRDAAERNPDEAKDRSAEMRAPRARTQAAGGSGG